MFGREKRLKAAESLLLWCKSTFNNVNCVLKNVLRDFDNLESGFKIVKLHWMIWLWIFRVKFLFFVWKGEKVKTSALWWWAMCLFNLLKLHYDFIVGDINRLLLCLFIVWFHQALFRSFVMFFACNQIHINWSQFCSEISLKGKMLNTFCLESLLLTHVGNQKQLQRHSKKADEKSKD